MAEGVITAEQLDAALRSQIVHGGRLGTNLVEQLRIPLDTIAEILGQQHDLPPALQQHFDRSDAEVQRLLDPAIAAEWHAVPIGRVSDSQVVVASTDPLPAEGLEALSHALGAEVVPSIAPEMRVLFLLEKIYGVTRLNRFLRLPPTKRSDFDSVRRYVRTLESAEPERPNTLARIAIRKIRVPTTDSHELAPTIESLDAGLRRMRRCRSRSRLGFALLHTIESLHCPPLAGALLLTLRGGLASGWKGVVPAGDSSVVDSVALSIGADPYLLGAIESHDCVLGPAPDDVVHQRLWHALEIQAPAQVACACTRLDGVPVAAIYVFGGPEVGSNITGDLQELAAALEQSFNRLLRAAER